MLGGILMHILNNVFLKDYTTYKIGGKADTLIFAESIEDLKLILLDCNLLYHKKEILILGNGSNLLINDKGFNGIVIKPIFKNILIKENKMTVQAGTTVDDMINFCISNNLTGLEIITGIPGNLGGVITMNAGFTKSISSIVDKVKVMDYSGNIKILNNKQMQFGYRTSLIQKEKLIVLEAVLNLKHGNIKPQVEKYIKLRTNNQPINYASCGSVFKKNNLHEFQGWSEGGAEVIKSYIVNKGNATFNDIITLINKIKKASKVKTDLEVIIIE